MPPDAMADANVPRNKAMLLGAGSIPIPSAPITKLIDSHPQRCPARSDNVPAMGAPIKLTSVRAANKLPVILATPICHAPQRNSAPRLCWTTSPNVAVTIPDDARRLTACAVAVAHIAGPHFSDTDGRLVNDLHRNDRALWAWTVDEPADIERMLRLGADGIISNWPDGVVSALAR